MAYNVLIIKLSALGDVIMASSMIKALRKEHKNVYITWYCGKEVVELVKLFEGVDEIICVDNSLLAGSFTKKVSFVFDAWEILKDRQFDLVLVAHSDARYNILTLGLKNTRRRSFADVRAPIHGRYHGTEYARLALGYDSSIEERYPLADLKIKPKVGYDDMVLLLAGGAKNFMNDDAIRRWPVENYIELARLIKSEGYRIGLIGSKGDLWTEDVFNESGISYESFVGKTDVKGLVELIAGAKAMVTHDTGPRHIADLTGTFSIGIFGPVRARER